MWLTMLASAMLANDSTYRSSPTVSGATATQIFSIMIILSHCLLVAITRLRAITSHYKEDHEVILILRSLTQPRKGWPCDRGCTFSILFERWGGFFYVPQEPDQERIWDKYWAISQTRAEGASFVGGGGGGGRLPQEQARCQLGKCFLSLKIYLLWKSWPISVSGGSRCGSAPADEWKRCETGLAYGFSSLSEKTRQSNHLQMSSQKKHFLLSYLKTLSVAGPAVIWTRDLPISRQALSQLS